MSVKNGTLLKCQDKRWCSFHFMLALASVTSANIFSHYPDCGEERDKNCFLIVKLNLKNCFELFTIFTFYFVFKVTFRPVICLSQVIMRHFLLGNVVIKENFLHKLIFRPYYQKRFVLKMFHLLN